MPEGTQAQYASDCTICHKAIYPGDWIVPTFPGSAHHACAELHIGESRREEAEAK